MIGWRVRAYLSHASIGGEGLYIVGTIEEKSDGCLELHNCSSANIEGMSGRTIILPLSSVSYAEVVREGEEE